VKRVIRPALYAAGALGGVWLANRLMPVNVDVGSAVAPGAGQVLEDVGDTLGALFAGEWARAGDEAKSIGRQAAAAGTRAASQVRQKIRLNIVLGVAAGSLAAGIVDALVLG